MRQSPTVAREQSWSGEAVPVTLLGEIIVGAH